MGIEGRTGTRSSQAPGPPVGWETGRTWDLESEHREHRSGQPTCSALDENLDDPHCPFKNTHRSGAHASFRSLLCGHDRSDKCTAAEVPAFGRYTELCTASSATGGELKRQAL